MNLLRNIFFFILAAVNINAEEQLIYDVAVVGGGLLGSATAKYVSEDAELSILIGPAEDAKLTAEIYGAWFDEGRIAELADSDLVWYKVAEQSIKRFREIESKSGIPFFTENGFMNVLSERETDPEDLDLFAEICDDINKDGHTCINLNKTFAQETFPYIALPDDFISYYQPDYSGVLNPRRLVEAQIKIAKEQGCHVLDGYATNIVRVSDSVFAISASHTDGSGESFIFAKKVILASGVYVNLNDWLQDLLPEDMQTMKPDLVLARETAAFLEVSPEEAERLKGMPNIVTHFRFGPLDGTYILPPIKYPDGKIYLKLGHLDAFETTIPDDVAEEKLKEWYQQGTGYPEAVEVLQNFIRENFMPDIEILSVHGAACVIAKTPDMANPYIGYMADGLLLVGGGNGFGANGSDEIGRIGAKLATTGQWTSDIPQQQLAVQWTRR